MLYKYYTNQRNLSSLNNKRLNNLYEWAIDKNKKGTGNTIPVTSQHNQHFVKNIRLNNLYDWAIDKDKKDT